MGRKADMPERGRKQSGGLRLPIREDQTFAGARSVVAVPLEEATCPKALTHPFLARSWKWSSSIATSAYDRQADGTIVIDNNLCDRRSVSRLPLMFEECE